jgi:hypothetical protein
MKPSLGWSDVALQGHVGALERLLLQGLLENRLELLQLEGLGEEVQRAGLHGEDGLLDRGVPGQHDHLGRGGALLDLPQQVEAGAVGHPDVEEGDVESVLAQHLARLAEVARGHDAIVRVGQLVPDQLPKGFLVIDEE